MKRKIAGILCCMILAGALTACGGKTIKTEAQAETSAELEESQFSAAAPLTKVTDNLYEARLLLSLFLMPTGIIS